MFSSCFALLLSSLTGGNVFVVEPTGQYAQILEAVAAANDGDLILVRTGLYNEFTVQGKSLTIVADTGAVVTMQGQVSVLDLAADQSVCLIGLRLFGEQGFWTPTPWDMRAQGNLGRVRVEHCELIAHMRETDGARVESCSDVSFVGCHLHGGNETQVASAGARIQDSNVTFFDCTVQGGYGWSDSDFGGASADGGAGLRAENSTVFSSNTQFQGGAGGIGTVFGPMWGMGASGVELVGTCAMRTIGSSMLGGLEGDYSGIAAPGSTGGVLTQLTGTSRTMTGANPVRELLPLSFSLHGEAGESVYLLVGLQPGLQWDPTRKANFLLSSPFRTLPVGATNGSGDLNVSLPLSDLGSGVQSEMFYLQPLFVGPGGAQQLGTPITLAALDQAF